MKKSEKGWSRSSLEQSQPSPATGTTKGFGELPEAERNAFAMIEGCGITLDPWQRNLLSQWFAAGRPKVTLAPWR